MNSTMSQRFVRPRRLVGQLAGILVLFNLLWPVQAQPPQEEGERYIVTVLDLLSPTNDITTIPGQSSNSDKQEKFLEHLDKRLNNPGKAKGLTKKLFQYVPSLVIVPDAETLEKLDEMVADREIDLELDTPQPASLSASVPLIGADTVWNQGYTGSGQVVAILDTGVDKTHPDLAGKVVSEGCYSPSASTYNASSVCPGGSEESTDVGSGMNCATTIAGCDHGTHVAGIVAANGSVKGVAKDAQLIAMQVFSKFDNASYCGASSPCALSFTSAQIAALERVLELYNAGMTNIATVNMSLGGGNYASACSSSMQGIVDQLRAVGIAVIAASGNSSQTNGIASPACVSSVISVGNTTKNDTVAPTSNSAEILDLLAPGSMILSTVPGGATAMKTGTSMAAPHVAAAWAVLKAAVSSASVDDILNALKQTGVTITDSRNGIKKPRIDLAAALKFLNPSQTDPANIEVSPVALDFGNRKEGTTSPAKTVTVSNSGAMGLNVGQTTLSDTNNFSISTNNCANQTVSAGSQCTINLTFNPTSPGVKNATLSISSNDTDSPTVVVTLTGNGIAIQRIDANPTAYDFGNVELGQSSGSTPFTISNNGGSDLTIGTVTRTGDFIILANNCSDTIIPPTGSCQIEVKFEPQSTGTKTGALSISSDDPNTPELQISLTGNGIDNTEPLPPTVRVNPGSHDFGEVTVGQSASKTIEVSNIGDGELFVGIAEVDNAAFQVENGCEGRSLPKGTKCPIKVEFLPGSEGDFAGTMSIENNSEDPEVSVPVQGQGIAPQDSVPVESPPPIAKAACQLYGVHDQGLNNSQFFTITKTDKQITPLGSTYEGYDIEALAIHPETDEIYAASGNDTAEGKPKGHLYRVDGQTGELVEVGSTGFNEIGDLAFSSDGTLWAWAKKNGLITINTSTGEGTLSIESGMPVEGLTVSKSEPNIFYAAVNRDLMKYDGQLETICDGLLEGETEALEMLPSGNILIGVHNNKDYTLKVIDPNNNCDKVKEADVPSGKYNDVEGVGWPVNACNEP